VILRYFGVAPSVFLGKTVTPTGFEPFPRLQLLARLYVKCHPAGAAKSGGILPENDLADHRFVPAGSRVAENARQTFLEMVTKAAVRPATRPAPKSHSLTPIGQTAVRW